MKLDYKADPKRKPEDLKRKSLERNMVPLRILQCGIIIPATFNVRGPVSISYAKSIDVVMQREIQITKSSNVSEIEGKDSSTMGRKYIIDKGAYVFTGGIFPQLAELTGFTDEDAEKIRKAIINMFVNDASAARPNGSMTLVNLYWWRHKTKWGDCPPVVLHRSLDIQPAEQFPYYTVTVKTPQRVEPEVYSAI